ncbi:hypothetical protein BT63DRAFT_439292 [Microthyrium microscopicum]|uniref:Hydrophobin n=1 Tax=Microthyrium microscopicum TaxID=703497 RepID=A0A6A6UDH5_9PEZI|nr:hypothetical protein BT63DRAFT_439292 [Microthyrium microscopicum]
MSFSIRVLSVTFLLVISVTALPAVNNTGLAQVNITIPEVVVPKLSIPNTAEVEINKRKIPAMPSMPPITSLPSIVNGVNPSSAAGCSNSSNQQSNQCSSGVPYCCSPDGDGGHNCENSAVNCKQTVICCNNGGGMQLCLGNIDFNMPITLNVNMKKRRSVAPPDL